MKNNQPVLVILTPGFPENESDSSCLPFIQSLIRTINKDFPLIKIIALSFQYPFSSKEYFWNNNQIISFGGKNKGKLLRRFLWFRIWRKLKKLKDENNLIGLFSLWFGECAFIGNRFGNKYEITHRCWLLGQDARKNNKFVSRINPDTKELIAISDFVADQFFKNYLIRPRHVIPNGIEKTSFQNDSYERSIDVLGAGSLIPLKRYHLFINCIAGIQKTIPNVYAAMAGKGAEEMDLKNQITERLLQNNIFLNGEMTHESLLHLMQRTKVFLHPSSYEGFSMVCLEALYAGCHVISFCKPMNKDFDHWHIVKNEEEMIGKTLEILTSAAFEYKSVMPYSINETAKSVMNLFPHKPFTN
jgi:glycosyltransferase involved in cell wall biosynthesis